MAEPTSVATEQPKRIQRKRTRGWKMPENTVYVGRGSKWGNPYRIGPHGDAQRCVDLYREHCTSCLTRLDEQAEEQLRGKSLACFCPLDQPCHADVLLELANA